MHLKGWTSEQQNVPLDKDQVWAAEHSQPHYIVKGLPMSWERCTAWAKAPESFTDVLNPQHANLRQIELWKFDQNVNAKMAQYSPLPPLPTMWIIRLPLSCLIEAWQELSLNTDLLSILHRSPTNPQRTKFSAVLCAERPTVRNAVLTKNRSVMFVITVWLNRFERVCGWPLCLNMYRMITVGVTG